MVITYEGNPGPDNGVNSQLLFIDYFYVTGVSSNLQLNPSGPGDGNSGGTDAGIEPLGKDSSGSKARVGPIVGGVIGGAVGLAILIAVFWFLIKRARWRPGQGIINRMEW
ncbi:hypothetical protein MPER_00289 [Moniliophthora perniciosa FA553]|nr:hypothetical protein MPER_00289 [Moniliophthora perniciosa FA553]